MHNGIIETVYSMMKKIRGRLAAHRERFEQERERIHRQMLSSVSHDLRTPLAAIIGSLEIYERIGSTLSDEKRKTLIATALQEAYRLDTFITNILDMARLDGGQVKIKKELCDIGTLLRNCVERISNRFECDISIAPMSEQLFIETDISLFCRALNLLIDNAVKYGGNPPKVRISASQDNQQIKIDVMDNGAGIPSDQMEDIFSKYTRLKHGDHQNAGTGLGLAIGKSIAKLLGGQLNVANNVNGNGATFTLAVPIGP